MDEITRLEIATLEIKPGQVLVVKWRGNPTGSALHFLHDELKKRFPVSQFMVVSDAIEFTVIDASAA